MFTIAITNNVKIDSNLVKASRHEFGVAALSRGDDDDGCDI